MALRMSVMRVRAALQLGIVLALATANWAPHFYHDFFHSDIIKGFKIMGHPVNFHFLVRPKPPLTHAPPPLHGLGCVRAMVVVGARHRAYHHSGGARAHGTRL